MLVTILFRVFIILVSLIILIKTFEGMYVSQILHTTPCF
jgi:hypothetical protein